MLSIFVLPDHFHAGRQFHFDVIMKTQQDFGYMTPCLSISSPPPGDDPPACDRGEDEPESISALQSTIRGRRDSG